MSSATIELVNGTVPSMSAIIKPLGDSIAEAKSDIVDQVVIKYNRSKSLVEKLEGKRFSLAALLGFDRGSEFFLIDVYQATQLKFTLQYRITHVEYGSIDLPLNFSLGAKEGGELTMSRELLRRDTPSSLMNDKINQWVTKSVNDGIVKLYKDFNSFSTTFRQYMIQQAAVMGVRLEININISSEIIKESIRPSARDISIQPKGYNNFIQLGFDAVMTPNEKLRDSVLVGIGYNNRGEFQQLLVSWLQEYIRKEVSYNEMASYLHGKVRVGIIEHWNTLLTEMNKGWLVAELVLHSSEIPAEIFKFERMEINVQIRNARIPMINTLILNLEDSERYKNSRIENLEAWIREKLQQSTQNVLAKVFYAELVSRIDQLSSIIKSDLDKQAQRIGYRVEYLLTSELVDKAKLKFKFELEKEEQSFQTTLNDMVNLNVIVDGRIKSLDHDFWRANLTPETHFIQEMKKEVQKDVRQFLLRVNANEFYTQFTEVVEPRLASNLKNMLVEQFNVEAGVDIFLKIEPSVLTQLIQDLQRGQHTTIVSLFEDKVVLEITFSVMGVVADQWALFASRSNNNANEIITLISKRISVDVENNVKRIMNTKDIRNKALFAAINKLADSSNKVIQEKMGLMIDIIDVRQLKNEIDSGINLYVLESEQKKIMRLLTAIQEIEEKIFEAETNDDFEWAKKLEEDKKRLQEKFEKNNFGGSKLPEQTSAKNLEKGDADHMDSTSEENSSSTDIWQNI